MLGCFRVSSPKNETSVINLMLFETMRPPFIFKKQIQIFVMESESSQTLHRQQGSLHNQGPET